MFYTLVKGTLTIQNYIPAVSRNTERSLRIRVRLAVDVCWLEYVVIVGDVSEIPKRQRFTRKAGAKRAILLTS